jgi:uncharacterized protein YbjT (DUF2867 family)
MKILLTGATGYIGKRLLPVLVQQGHQVICCVRDTKRFNPPSSLLADIEVIEVDLLERASLEKIPKDIEGAYYLVHSMSASHDYPALEVQCAENFRDALEKTAVKHVIYLSGIINETDLSEHLASRKAVEEILQTGNFNLTTLRAGIIIGSGSASFEIIRDLTEKLPLMITPKWLDTKCQPIGIRNVIDFLSSGIGHKEIYNESFDIGGPDILTYREMILVFAKVRGLSRYIYTVPVMTPRLSSYWLYFVTSTSYKLATALVNSMKVEVVCRDTRINEILGIQPEGYEKSIKRAFTKIESNEILSSWKDSQISGVKDFNISDFINVPSYGCYKDIRSQKIESHDYTIQKIWGIGGENGWYAANFLWQLRGYIDKLYGGVGLRRGRTSKTSLEPGDALDFWRVLYANKTEGRLLLFAEMKLPGEAWLEFRIQNDQLIQTATFRPSGLWGRLYWFAVVPLHGIVFKGMLNAITKVKS